MGIRLVQRYLRSLNCHPLCSLDNFIRNIKTLLFQASLHTSYTALTATVSYEPGLALILLFTSFPCDEFTLKASYWCYSESNQLYRTENTTLNCCSTLILLIRIEHSSHTLSPYEKTTLNSLEPTQDSYVKRFHNNHHNHVFESYHCYPSYTGGRERLDTMD
jgi:hypothetical protein